MAKAPRGGGGTQQGHHRLHGRGVTEGVRCRKDPGASRKEEKLCPFAAGTQRWQPPVSPSAVPAGMKGSLFTASSPALILKENVFPKVWSEERGSFPSASQRDPCPGHRVRLQGGKTAPAEENLENGGNDAGNTGNCPPGTQGEAPAVAALCADAALSRQHQCQHPARGTGGSNGKIPVLGAG